MVEHYAVNVDPREGDLTRVEEEAFPALYPGVELRFASEIEALPSDVTQKREGELWRALLWSLIVLLAAEMGLAWWFGRR